MAKTLFARLALAVSHAGFVTCLVAGLTSGLSFAWADDGEFMTVCIQSTTCVAPDPLHTCSDFRCPQPSPTFPVCICMPGTNATCFCGPAPIPG